MDGGSLRWETLIRNALVFDGSGAAPAQMDVAVSGDRIVAMGPGLASDQAHTVIDAEGRWLVPGMLDIHTHFDLEVEIEPQLPEAVRHGTTTVLVANCSLGLAFGNQRRGSADPVVDCFARVENVPKAVLRKVADAATWTDSKAYLDHFGGMPLGPNIVPMIPHSMLRIEAMGLQDSLDREPRPEELAHMGALLEKGMSEGYVGFSTDGLPFHFLANRPNTHKQIPTQFAPFSELKFLTDVVRRWGRVWQATPPKDSPTAVFRNFLLTSGRLYGRTLKITAVAAIDVHMNRGILRAGLFLSRLLNSRFLRGHFRLQALSAPFKVWSDGVVTPLAEEVPALRRLNELDLDDRAGRAAVMNDPAWVADFRSMWFRGKRGFNLARLKRWLRLDDNVLSRDLRDMTIDTCPCAAWNGELMQSVFERLLAWQAGKPAVRSEEEAQAFASFPQDCDEAAFFLHLLRRYDTALRWWTITANRNRETTKALLFHPLLLPGFNDSGAHLTNMAFYDGNLRTLKFAQEDGVQKVAHAVHRLTCEPAAFLGIDAGRLAIGARADLVLIDPERLRAWNPDESFAYIWRECFENHQIVNRPDGVVTDVMIAGRYAWREGAAAPAFGQAVYGQVLLNRRREARETVTA